MIEMVFVVQWHLGFVIVFINLHCFILVYEVIFMARKLNIYFSDFFDIDPILIKNYGAFNISLIKDLPLFVDPFLLFNSKKDNYQSLHRDTINYVKFLKNESRKKLPEGLIKSWFHFPEVKQNWLGYSEIGNGGRGLGGKFASSLKLNLTSVFSNFGEEVETASHLEKLALIKNGVGKDQISDFVCNFILGFLAKYTEDFAVKYIDKKKCDVFMVGKAEFNWKTKTWEGRQFTLPRYGNDFVLLTPVDLLTKDEAWINHKDFVEDFSSVIGAVSNEQLRCSVDQYFASIIPDDPTKKDYEIAIEKVVEKYPQVLDAYIAIKERNRGEATLVSEEKISLAMKMFVGKLVEFTELLDKNTDFYKQSGKSREEALERVNFLKHVIEAQDGYRLFYIKGRAIKREQDLQTMFKLTWFASVCDMNAEVNNGRGPADFLVSKGSADKVVVEFKLASNSHIERNLINQAEIYSDASRANHPPIKVILYFTDLEFGKIDRLLVKHGLKGKAEIVLIDATPKDSGSKVGLD